MGKMRRVLVIAATGAALLIPAVGLAAATSVTVVASGDAFVESDRPKRNHGTGAQLRVGDSPVRQTFFKFRVAGVGSATVRSAKLRLYSVAAAPVGGDLLPVADSSWTEKSITWNNAPGVSASTALSSLGAVAVNSWYELDVGASIRGDGTYSFRLSSPSNKGATFASKEAGGGVAPRLVIALGTDSSPPAVSLTSPAAGAALWGTATVAASASDDVGLAKVEFLVGGSVKRTVTAAPYSWAWDTTTVADGSHSVAARAVDLAGNASTSASIAVTVKNNDTSPPSPPQGVTAVPVGESYVALSWSPSTDDRGVAGYTVFRDGAVAGTSETPLFADFGAGSGAGLEYQVVAYDAAGNLSPPSGSVPATSAAPPPGAVVAPVHPAIAGDCTTDVSAAVNSFLSQVPDGVAGAPNTIRFGSEACYLVNDTLLLEYRAHLVVDGGDSVFQATRQGPVDRSGVSHRQHWRAVSGLDLTFTSIRVRGPNNTSDVVDRPELGSSDDGYGGEDGFLFRLSTGVVLRDSEADGVWGNGVTVDHSQDVTVERFTVGRNGTSGALVLDARNVVFDGMTVLHSRRHGWKIEPELNEMTSGVEIRNSEVCAYLNAFFSSGVKGTSNDVSVHDNRVTCSNMVAVLVRAEATGQRRNWEFRNNVVEQTTASKGAALWFDVVDDVRVNDNDVAVPAGALGVSFASATGTLEVQRNDFHQATAVYAIDGRVGGPGVDAWGNTTIAGPDQP
jgi:hypothetical protein